MERSWMLRPASSSDGPWLADLKALVMRPDLERLGLWDHTWARQRLLDTYVPANTEIVEIDGKPVGSIAVRAESDAQWLEHFYLHPTVQGRGIGGQVLHHVMNAHRDARPFRLAIDKGSAVRRLYERAGFTYLHDDHDGYDEVFENPGQ